MVNLRDFAKALGIKPNAVRAAMVDGRISSFEKTKKGYQFDLDRALNEYEENTNRSLSSNTRFDEESDTVPFESDGSRSVLDKDPKFWNVNEALQAKTIFSALKVKHELEVQQGKFYSKDEADREINRIATTFARGLRSMPTRIKQKIPDLTFDNLKVIEDLATELITECESKL